MGEHNLRPRTWVTLALALVVSASAASSEQWQFRADYDQAFSGGQYQRAEKIAATTFHKIATPADFNNPIHVQAARMLAHMRAWQARYDEARLLLRAVANWFNKHPDTDAAERAAAYGQLAGVYRELHAFAGADAAIELALQAIAQASLAGSALHARVLQEKVTALTAQRRRFEALAATSQLLHVRQQLYGANDPRVARTLLAINNLIEHPLRVAEMQTRHARASRILHDAYARRAPTQADAIRNLIALYQAEYPPQQESTDQICGLRNSLIRTVEESHGAQSRRLIEPLTELAQFCSDAMSDTEVVTLLRRALQIADTTFSVDHPLTMRIQRELAESIRITAWNKDEEPPDEASVLDALALKNTKRLFGERSPISAYAQFLELLDGQRECVFADASCGREITRQLNIVGQSAGDAHPYIALLQQSAAARLEQSLEFDESEAERKAKTAFILDMSRHAVSALAKHYDKLDPQYGEAAVAYALHLLRSPATVNQGVRQMRAGLDAYRDYFGELDAQSVSLWHQYVAGLIDADRLNDASQEIERAVTVLKTDSADHLEPLQAFLSLRERLRTAKRFR
jgi:hypothetical protein